MRLLQGDRLAEVLGLASTVVVGPARCRVQEAADVIPTVLVINLSRRLDRATRVTDRLNAASLPYQIMVAYDGQSLGAPDGWRPGAWGCLQSHLQLWRWAAENDQMIFVMEDDATFRFDLGVHITELMAGEWDCIRLGDTTVAYIVKPHVCRFWVEQLDAHLAEVVGLQVDSILKVLHGLSLTVSATPWLVKQEDPRASDTR
jgi:hypothetical protein